MALYQQVFQVCYKLIPSRLSVFALLLMGMISEFVNENPRKPEATSFFLLALVNLPFHMHISLRE